MGAYFVGGVDVAKTNPICQGGRSQDGACLVMLTTYPLCQYFSPYGWLLTRTLLMREM